MTSKEEKPNQQARDKLYDKHRRQSPTINDIICIDGIPRCIPTMPSTGVEREPLQPFHDVP